mmetsp:Transcript_53802/g.127161  ORF Transcript_53802/g.127161 Transcript_53802/m.127161 type:complete len:200 (-) Transcript_53802:85-684(-)
MQLDVGFLKDRNPQLAVEARERAQQPRWIIGALSRGNREQVVDDDLAHGAVEVHLDDVLAVGADDGAAVALRVDVLADEGLLEATLPLRTDRERGHERAVPDQRLLDVLGVEPLDHLRLLHELRGSAPHRLVVLLFFRERREPVGVCEGVTHEVARLAVGREERIETLVVDHGSHPQHVLLGLTALELSTHKRRSQARR